jgi:hypothetical protein
LPLKYYRMNEHCHCHWSTTIERMSHCHLPLKYYYRTNEPLPFAIEVLLSNKRAIAICHWSTIEQTSHCHLPLKYYRTNEHCHCHWSTIIERAIDIAIEVLLSNERAIAICHWSTIERAVAIEASYHCHWSSIVPLNEQQQSTLV